MDVAELWMLPQLETVGPGLCRTTGYVVNPTYTLRFCTSELTSTILASQITFPPGVAEGSTLPRLSGLPKEGNQFLEYPEALAALQGALTRS